MKTSQIALSALIGLSLNAQADLGQSVKDSSAASAQSSQTGLEKGSEFAASATAKMSNISVKAVGYSVDGSAYVVTSTKENAVSAAQNTSESSQKVSEKTSEVATSAAEAVSNATVTVFTSTGEAISAVLADSGKAIKVSVKSTGEVISEAGNTLLGYAQSGSNKAVASGKYLMTRTGELVSQAGRFSGKAITASGKQIQFIGEVVYDSASNVSQTTSQFLNYSSEKSEAMIIGSRTSLVSFFGSEKLPNPSPKAAK